MGRKYSLDLIRILATCMVIIVHTKDIFFNRNLVLRTWSVFRVLGTYGVPLFVLLTGYLMLHKDFEEKEYLNKFVKHNILPLLISFEFWNIAWFVLNHIPVLSTYQKDIPTQIDQVIKSCLFIGNTNDAMWYLHMILGLYLGMPIVSLAIKRLKGTSYAQILFVLLVLCGTIVPSLGMLIKTYKIVFPIFPVLNLNIFAVTVWGNSVWMLYLLAGYLVRQGSFRRISSAKLFMMGVLVPAILSYRFELYCIRHHLPSLVSYDFILIVLTSISTFELFTRLDGRYVVSSFLQSIIGFVSKYSFSVYMLHLFVCAVLYKAILKIGGWSLPIGYGLPKVVHIFTYGAFVISVFLLSEVIAYIFGKIPCVKKWLFMVKD